MGSLKRGRYLVSFLVSRLEWLTWWVRWSYQANRANNLFRHFPCHSGFGDTVLQRPDTRATENEIIVENERLYAPSADRELPLQALSEQWPDRCLARSGCLSLHNDILIESKGNVRPERRDSIKPVLSTLPGDTKFL